MVEKKVFIHSTDSTIAIIEGIFNYDDYTIKILRKKTYLKSRFFEVHSKVLQQVFSSSQTIPNIDIKTNLLPASEIYKLLLEHSSTSFNCTIQGKYEVKEEGLKRTYRLLIDSNFEDIHYQDKLTEKRIMSELTQKSFGNISDYSFLIFVNSLPRKIEVHQQSFYEQLQSKQIQERNSIDPLFGGALTNRGILNIFL